MLLDDPLASEGMLRLMEMGERARAPVQRGPRSRVLDKARFWSDEDTPDLPDRSEAARQVRAENSRRMQASLIRCPRASRVS